MRVLTPGYRRWVLGESGWQGVLRDRRGDVVWACDHNHEQGRGMSEEAAEWCAGERVKVEEAEGE